MGNVVLIVVFVAILSLYLYVRSRRLDKAGRKR